METIRNATQRNSPQWLALMCFEAVARNIDDFEGIKNSCSSSVLLLLLPLLSSSFLLQIVEKAHETYKEILLHQK